MAPIILPFQGHTPKIHPSAYIAPGASIIGAVEIDEQASIWFGCVLRGDDNYIKIGARTSVQDGAVIHVTKDTSPTEVGNDVVIGHGARLHGCIVHDKSLIGIGAIMLDGAVVESDAMVAAGAMVAPNKRIPAGQIWAGNPAKFLREMRTTDRDFMIWDREHYVKLTDYYRSAT